MSTETIFYNTIGVLGALFIIVYQIHHHAYITVVVNIIWAIVAFHGLTSFAQRYLDHRKRQQPPPNP